MSWLLHTSIILAKLFCLRAKPSDVPYSRVLLALIATAFLFVDCITDIWFVDIVNNYDGTVTVYLSWYYALFMSLIWLLVLYAMTRTALVYYHHIDRLVQVMTAFLWVDLMLGIIYLGGVAVLSELTLPLEDNAPAAIGLMVAFVVYLYWQFMLYLHIIYNTLGIPLLLAGIYTLLYMLLQYNISEILINVMVVENLIQ